MTTANPLLAEARDVLVGRLNKGVNLLAGRNDLIVSVEWDAGPATPPAWFTFAKAEVSLNGPVALAGAEPSQINPLTPAGRRRHPVIVGLLCHEAAHAHSTHWEHGFDGDIPVVVARAAVLLEDPRIERRQLQRRPGDQLYLRAASQLLILPDAESCTEAAGRWHAAQAALLTAGRVDAGVLDKNDVRKVVELCLNALGRTDFNRLRALWRDALDLDDGDVAGLLDIAAQWVEVVGVEDPADAPAPACATGLPEGHPAAPGQDGDDEPEGSGDDRETPASGTAGAAADALARAFRDAMDKSGERGAAQAAADLDDDADQDQPSTSGEDSRERAAAERAADEVFHGYIVTGGRDPRAKTRQPTPSERDLARRTAQALRRAQFRERSRTVIASAVPPGRLSGREAMLGAAQRARKMPVTARPFRQVVQRETPEPPLTVGIAVDISGSMSWATTALASTAWLVAHAVDDVGGNSATVAFGERVTAITKPGVPPTVVQEFVADDGHERFADAMQALDGGLRLTSGAGARLVFVVSDGHFVLPGEMERAQTIVDRFVRSGVHVLWLDLTSNERSERTIVPEGAIPVPVTDVTEIPHQVGAIAVRALRTA
ncbi:hypothetical protein CFP71_10005 [Amycolatopsis thailandensis]|uniref:VWA domain-containing protein n=1 Tax=Amycolatopsis thailandensis TaxID=589330 RepID=A0A229SEA4_9PSEU|nr:VWA domain-containing protein [Amycolatopsis thailandensis]OXM57059.1 hypothetical protein CFP71_10005 [Amycolatopsis thailandensis]